MTQDITEFYGSDQQGDNNNIQLSWVVKLPWSNQNSNKGMWTLSQVICKSIQNANFTRIYIQLRKGP